MFSGEVWFSMSADGKSASIFTVGGEMSKIDAKNIGDLKEKINTKIEELFYGKAVSPRVSRGDIGDRIIYPEPEPELQAPKEDEPPWGLEMEFVDLSLEEVPVEQVVGQKSVGSRTLRASGRLRIYSDGPECGSVPYRIEFMLENLDTADSRMAAADSGTIQPGELSRSIIRDFPIPARGHYKVSAVVRTAPNSGVLSESVGPMLRVVE